MTTDYTDREITLGLDGLRLRVSPYGAALRGLWREAADGSTQEIVTAYSGAHGKIGGQGDVLIPFPGRIREGRYVFDGRTYQMERNDKESPAAIHGFLRSVPWTITSQSETAIEFAADLDPDAHPGYPFALRSTVRYALDTQGLTCGFTLTNIGGSAAPVAAGFHPYFTVGSEQIDTDTLHVPMASTLEFADLLPTGRILPVEGTPFDFRTPRRIDATVLNTCYLNPIRDADGMLRVTLTSESGDRSVTVWMDRAFDYVVLYSGNPLPEPHRRRSLAIEPMTCASDGFNHADWGVVRLEPGETHAGAWGVRAS